MLTEEAGRWNGSAIVREYEVGLPPVTFAVAATRMAAASAHILGVHNS
jgi:hypothetical protein